MWLKVNRGVLPSSEDMGVGGALTGILGYSWEDYEKGVHKHEVPHFGPLRRRPAGEVPKDLPHASG